MPTAGLQRDLLVHAEQVRVLYSQLPKSMAGMVVGGLVVIGGMWNQIAHWILLVWYAALLLHQSWRLQLFLRYRRSPPTAPEAKRRGIHWAIGAGISGMVWGSAGIFMFVPDAPAYQAFLIIVLFVVAAGALTLLAVHSLSFHAFLLPTILPVIVRAALEGNTVHWFISAACLVVLVMLLAIGRNLNRLLTESLYNRFENVDLITELKAQKQVADEARQASETATRARTQFFAAASHDLRQPLHAMGLFAAALSQKPLDPDVLGIVNNINSSVRTLESLFNELLDIYKIDAGAVQPDLRDFPVKPMLDRLRDEFLAEASENGLLLTSQAGDCSVRSDPVLLERILRNLISNAIHHTPRGEVAITGGARDGKLLFEVRDTGVGITEEDQLKIFDEFYQVGNPGGARAKGLGLGLSIVKRLCDLLEYPVRVRAQVGRGSTFSVEVPLANRLVHSPLPRPMTPASQCDLSGRLVVVIDDETTIVDGMKALLGGWGATVIGSTTGEDVVNAVHVAGKLPDLIIADYHLGAGPDGIEIARRIRQDLDPEIPVILVTGTMAPDLLENARADRLEFLHKPVVPDKLHALINLKVRRLDSAAT